MAHLAPHLQNQHHHHSQPPTAAIFSPSVARAAASTAKDWSYVDDWLSRKYASASPAGGRKQKPPQFERNPETLKALLALATANEAADEERAQLLRIEEAALEEEKHAVAEQQQKQQQQQQRKENEEEDGEQIVEGILSAIEEGLSREGRTALDAMAEMAVELGEASPTPQTLAASFVELQGRLGEAELAAKRVGILQDYLDEETARIDALLRKIRVGGDDYTPDHADPGSDAVNPDLDADAADLARRNLELQRAVKAMATKLPELEQQVDAIERAAGGEPQLTVDEVRADEEAYLELLAKKRELDVRIAAFVGLPPDVDAARAELEALRTELRELTERRDANFEKLVERESPVKSRGRRF